MALRACSCGEYHDRTERCPRARQRREASRPTAAQRGYDKEWRRLSRQVVAEEGACRVCGHTGSSDNPLTADHIVSLAAGGARLDRANVQCLCRWHNSSKGRRSA